MQFRFIAFIIPSMIAWCVMSTFAAPVEPRQVGNLQCNIDRASIVANLAKTKSAVNDVATAGAGDTSVTDATSTALTALNSAQSGIGTIAAALLKGQTAPADARDQVQQGLTDAGTALDSITSTDTSVTSALTNAQSLLGKAATAGQGVVSNCK